MDRFSNKILITGCARSGTTLLLYLSQYFKNVQAMTDAEYKPTQIDYKNSPYFIKSTPDKILVIKRPIYVKNSPHYESIKKILKCKFKIIFLIRDGRDVLVSRHPPIRDSYHVEPERWIKSAKLYFKYKNDDRFLFIKYENLSRNPDNIMQQVGEFIGTDFDKNYVNFYMNVTDKKMKTGLGPMKYGLGFKGARPIATDSIGNWKSSEHHERINQILKGRYGEIICNLLIKLGYETNLEWADAYKT